MSLHEDPLLSRRTVIAGLGFLTAGCDTRYDPPKTIRLVGAAQMTSADVEVITSRLADQTYKGVGRAPRYDISRESADVIISASAAPADDSIRYLAGHRGRFLVRTEGGLPWFDQSQLDDVQVSGNDQQGSFLRLRLKSDGAQRVAKLSAAGSSVLVAQLDNKVLSTGRVTAPIPTGLMQITAGHRSNEELQLLATILRFGALSYEPGEVQVVTSRG